MSSPNSVEDSVKRTVRVRPPWKMNFSMTGKNYTKDRKGINNNKIKTNKKRLRLLNQNKSKLCSAVWTSSFCCDRQRWNHLWFCCGYSRLMLRKTSGPLWFGLISSSARASSQVDDLSEDLLLLLSGPLHLSTATTGSDCSSIESTLSQHGWCWRRKWWHKCWLKRRTRCCPASQSCCCWSMQRHCHRKRKMYS